MPSRWAAHALPRALGGSRFISIWKEGTVLRANVQSQMTYQAIRVLLQYCTIALDQARQKDEDIERFRIAAWH